VESERGNREKHNRSSTGVSQLSSGWRIESYRNRARHWHWHKTIFMGESGRESGKNGALKGKVMLFKQKLLPGRKKNTILPSANYIGEFRYFDQQ
jgi:hypothetical protein